MPDNDRPHIYGSGRPDSAWLITLATVCCLLTGCHRSPLQPQSGGKPYEVVLTGDIDSAVYRQLTLDVEGLPQPEPWFDVVVGQEQPLARNIVKVDADSVRYTRTHIRYEQDVNAAPQLIVYIHTPSGTALRREMPALGERLRRLLAQAESDRTRHYLSERHNSQAEDTIRKMFGIELSVPDDLTAQRRDKDFIWLSNTSAEAQRCLCVYAVRHAYAANDMSIRDSVMKRHIKGETDAMYMRTTPGTVSAYSYTARDGRREYVARGLWEMEGDAMGGPFSQHIIPIDSTLTIVVEAFVFAPGMKKRNMMRQLEAAIFGGFALGQEARGKGQENSPRGGR